MVTSESSFPLPQQHGLVRHALRGHPTHEVQNFVVLRRQQPNPQLEPIFYPGAIAQREASSALHSWGMLSANSQRKFSYDLS